MIFIGTYSNRGSEGIYRALLDTKTGRLYDLVPAARLSNPTFQIIHPTGGFLYSVSEERHDGTRMNGSVHAFAIDPKTGGLEHLDQKFSKGDGPCHLCVDSSGRHLLVANYASGSLAVFPILESGALAEASGFIQHHGGSGIIPDRQEGPHAHSITLSPDDQFAFAADLGMDQVLSYRLDALKGTLTACNPPGIICEPGSGPRHMAFHPDGRHVFLVHELDNTVTGYRYDATNGTLEAIQTLPSLPENWTGASFAADIHVSPDGRYLYASNRGHDSVVFYAIDRQSGMLSLKGFAPSKGRWPRNFLLTQGGKLMLVANQESDSITVFRVDSDTGHLIPAGEPVPVPAPVCLTA